MPHSFFNTRDGDHFVRDELGLEVQGIEAGRDEPTRGMADLAKELFPAQSVEGKRRHHEQVHRRDFWHALRRNVHQLWPRGPRRLIMYLATVKLKRIEP
jgi:hypothetical protein